MKKLINNMENLLVDEALLEEGFDETAITAAQDRTFAESLEEHLVEIAFAEAADYNDIHEALLGERRMPGGIAHPDDCQYGDNEVCFLQG
jgi:hypothetical protein